MATEAITVAVRVRPMNSKEKEGGRDCITVQDNHQLVIDSKPFTFDRVFGGGTQQSELFSMAGPLLDDIFKGMNATIIAYGQTGSGKTHTMGTNSGLQTTEVEQGIIPRVVKDIFQRIEAKQTATAVIAVTASSLEIYNEEIKDLLHLRGGSTW